MNHSINTIIGLKAANYVAMKNALIPSNILCFGLLFVVAVHGQNKSPEKPQPAEKDSKTVQKNFQTTDKDAQCDFSAYNTVKATPLIEKQVKAVYPKAAARRKLGGEVKIKYWSTKTAKSSKPAPSKGINC